MPTNFYKSGGSYYTADTNSKIANLDELKKLSSLGGKEISAPTAPQGSSAIPNPQAIKDYNVTANIGGTLYGTPKNDMSSNTFNVGVQSGNVNLPSSNSMAMSLYTDRSLEDATKQQQTLQNELNNLKAQRIKDNETALKAEQENLKAIQGQKDSQISGYDAQMNPLRNKAIGIYDNMLSSIEGINYVDLTKQKLDLTNDIINYSKMMREELDAEASSYGLMSVSAGKQNAITSNYTSKIAIAQAAQSAIDGNFNLAFDIMDRGANAISRLTSDRINFINTVQSLFSQKENTSLSNILRLTNEEKSLLDQAVKDAETQLKNIETNKQTIMEIMRTNPIIANKARLSLTDTPEQITQKLNDFYVANPQYTPDNQDWTKKARDKYFDAGITLNDSIETVKSKISQSRIYQADNQNKPVVIGTDNYGNPIYGIYNQNTNSFDSPTNSNNGEMRTDRNNNPTAMTTDVAKTLGLVEGVDYVVGDKFPGDSNLYTAKLLGDPISTTIKALDIAAKDNSKQAFYTQGGQQRWNYIGMTDEQWLSMNEDQKKNIIGNMYRQEGGDGRLLNGGNEIVEETDPNVISWGNELASTGKMPSGVPKALQGRVTEYAKLAPKPEGLLIDKTTGLPSQAMTPAQKDGYLALYDLTKKTQELKNTFEEMNTGLFAGLKGQLFPSQERQVYDSLRTQVWDLLARARTGAAINTSEEALYKGMLPSAYNKTFFMGEDGLTKIQSFFDAMSGTLETKLNGFGADIVGRQKIVNGKTFTRVYNNGQWLWDDGEQELTIAQ